MRRGRVFFYLAFVLVLGLIAVLVVWQRVILPSQKKAASLPTETPVPVKIMVVTQKLPQGTVLDETVLQAVPWQQDAVLPGMFREEDLNELVGRKTKYVMEAQTPVMASMLLTADEQIPVSGSTWALQIPPGAIAVSIPINQLSSVSYAPRPGDHVDIIVTVSFVDIDTDFQSTLPNLTGLVVASGPPNPETGANDPLTVDVSPPLYGRVVIDPVLGQAMYVMPREGQRARLASQMLVQNAVVLRLGEFPLTDAKPTAEATQPAQEGEKEATPEPAKPDIVTLMVQPQDAVTLNYLIFSGAQLVLALRNPTDSSRVSISPVTLQFLLEQYQIPVPVRLPYGLWMEPRELVLPGVVQQADATPE